MFKCNQCKNTLCADNYGIKKQTGGRLLSCNSCREKNVEYRKTESHKASKKKANSKYNKSAKGRAFQFKRNRDPKYVEFKREYNKKPDQIEHQREGGRRFEKTEKRKTWRKEWKKTDVGKKCLKKAQDDRLQQLHDDPAKRMEWNMRVRITALIKGRIKKSKTLFSNSNFVDFQDILQHFKSQLSSDMTMENYGQLWHVDHRIPASVFDHNDPEDIRRCWSKSNLHPMIGSDNCKKSNKLFVSQCVAAGEACFPKAWGGSIPSGAYP